MQHEDPGTSSGDHATEDRAIEDLADGVPSRSDGQQRSASRLNNFTDAAFALALSLLLLFGFEGEDVSQRYDLLFYRVPGYLFAFAILANFWHAHVRWSERDGRATGLTTLATLWLIFLILVFVFPLRELTYMATDGIFGLSDRWQVGRATADRMGDLLRLRFCRAGWRDRTSQSRLAPIESIVATDAIGGEGRLCDLDGHHLDLPCVVSRCSFEGTAVVGDVDLQPHSALRRGLPVVASQEVGTPGGGACLTA